MARFRRIVASGRALAVLVLATAWIRVLFIRAFGHKTGLPLFRENYAKDRLPPVSPSERDELNRFSGCIACGRCDEGEDERVRASGGRYRGVMQFVLASSRSFPDFDLAAATLDFLPEAALREKERVCPTHVPIADLARFVRRKAAEAAAPI
jgi:succinate dehydrogenase/fumarate reductase-like Fe-S protein